MDYACGDLSDPRSQIFSSLLFSFRSRIVLAFTFRPMIHYRLTFVFGTKYESTFFWLHMNIQIFNMSTTLKILFKTDWLCTFVENHLTMYMWIYF